MPDVDTTIIRAAIALTCASVVSLVAWRKRLLGPGGAVAAVIIGSALVAFGGWWAGILLFSFFLTSSLLSTSDHDHPSRTWLQVVANGAPATAFSILAFVFVAPSLLVVSAATIAAATADTWATEIGRRSGATPVSVRTFRPAPIGTSGAVSLPGTLASIAGAMVIAILAALLAPLASMPVSIGFPELLAIVICGTIGSLVDTVLGAVFQARYRCLTCGFRTEEPSTHDASHKLVPESGVSWLTNDAVNLTASGIAGVIAAFIVR